MKFLFLLPAFFSLCFGQIRAVIFDFENVICEADDAATLRFLCNTLHLSKSEAERLLGELYLSEASIEEFWQNRGLDRAFAERFSQVALSTIQEVPGSLSVVEELREKMIRVGILSNMTARVADAVRSLGYQKWFDTFLLSCECGFEKPATAAFETLMNTLALSPNEILFIDTQQANLEIARKLGMETYQFKNAPLLKRELTQRGLLEEERLDLGSHTLWLESLGHRNAPAILLIAGANCHAHFWTDEWVLRLVQQGHFVVRFDQRDVGLSSSYPDSYELEELADEAILILDHYGVESAHVVGHSMGGYISQLLAIRHPNHVKSLTVIASGPIGATPETDQKLLPDEMQLLNRTFDLIFKNRPTADFLESLPGFLETWGFTNGDYALDWKMVMQYVQEIYYRTVHPIGFAHHHLQAMENAMHRLNERRALLPLLKMPFLVIHGGRDPLILPLRGGLALYKALPQAELKLFPKMGHMLFNRELESQVIETVKEFLIRHGA